jgi:type I restriction enzyme S subunit
MSRYKAYSHYRDSGVDWLGMVPSHWTICRIKNTATVNPAKSEVRDMAPNTEVAFIPMEAIGEKGELDTSRTKPLSEVISGYSYVADGDIMIAKITPCFENGKGAIARNLANGIGFATTEVINIRPNNPNDSAYLLYLLSTDPFRKLAEGAMYGAGGQKRVADSFVAEYHFSLPELTERSKIATFLDHETAKIDALIEKQQRLIELLKEKRQAVISHAVTKGLNPNTPMKDSGVEWLGEVPAHWDLQPLKYLCTFSGGGTPSKDNLSYWTEGNIPWVSPKDMKSFWINDSQDKITQAAVQGSSTNFVDAGSLLIVVRSGILQRTIPIAINTVPVTLNQDMKALSFISEMNVEFAANFILGNIPALLLEWSKEGATVESIEHEYLSSSVLPVPPYDEQLEINAAIRKRMESFDALEQQASTGITLLQERRTALISAAVTGKIDIRDWQAAA